MVTKGLLVRLEARHDQDEQVEQFFVSALSLDFYYVHEIDALDADHHVLVFHARIGNRKLEGCDFLHVGNDSLIDKFVVMIRPLSAALAFSEAMESQLTGTDAVGA